MAVGTRSDPYLGFNFLVEIDGIVAGGFSEISGLTIEIETEDYVEGGRNDFVHKLAGGAKFPSNLVLKHGITDSDALWDWYQDVLQGTIDRKSASVVLLDSTREERRRWNFEGCYPVRWVGPELRAGTAEVAVETLELVHQGMSRG
jgi:phage tail-like protein